MKKFLPFFISILIISSSVVSCEQQKDTAVLTHDSALVSKIYTNETSLYPQVDILGDSSSDINRLNTKNLKADSLVAFAKTLVAVPYKYASTNPVEGFDCSGFISYVFSYFRIKVPRSSIEFTNLGTEIPVQASRPGDLILFTGTDTSETKVGHMGIVVNNTDSLRFIHSSSGRANGVTITPLNDYYQSRFVKVIRIF